MALVGGRGGDEGDCLGSFGGLSCTSLWCVYVCVFVCVYIVGGSGLAWVEVGRRG